MSTCNYTTMENFDLWTTEYEWNKEISQDDNFFESEIFYSTVVNYAKELIESINNKLTFYKLELQDGYYEGMQVVVNTTIISDLDEDYECLTNDDTQYYFAMCRSEYLRKIKSEINKINKKYLPQFKNIGFHKLNCVGVFSNGEAIYELAKEG